MTDQQEALHFLDYWRVIRSRKEIVIAVSLLFVLTGIVVTYSLPRVYMASVVIQVQKSRPDVEVFEQERLLYDPLFMRTQFEIIQSAPVIEEVIRKRDLVRKLSAAYNYDSLPPDQAFDLTFKRIADGMKVQQFRDTNLIEIQFYLAEPKQTAPEEAAAAANAIADVFRDLNDRRSRKSTERALMALKEELDEQERRVQAAEQRVQDIRERYEITMVNPTVGEAGSLSKRSLVELEGQRVAVRLELAEKKARFDMINAMDDEELLAAAPYMVEDPTLIGLVNERRKMEVELQQLRKAYGPNYPDVVSAQASIDGLKEKIADALVGLKAGVAADYRAAQAKNEIIEGELREIKETEIKAESRGYREFEEAHAELERLRLVRNELEIRHVQERIEMRIPRTSMTVIEPAKAPDAGQFVSPKLALNIILSILAGLGAGVGLAYFIEYLDTSVKTIEDIERFMQLPVIGVIPQKVKPFVDEDAETMHAEPYRMLRTNIQFSKDAPDGKTFCVTSGSIGEGKSLTLFNLAYVCAQLGDKVLLVDSDLHRPRQHKIMGMSNAIGLANVLAGDTELDDAIVPTAVQNLDFLPSGKLRTGVHGLLATQKMHQVSESLRARYDYVLFDAPPIIGVSDASLLVREMDGVLLVVQHRKYPKTVSARAKGMIENMGGRIVGVVLNSINISRDYSSYYYHSYSYPKYMKAGEKQS